MHAGPATPKLNVSARSEIGGSAKFWEVAGILAGMSIRKASDDTPDSDTMSIAERELVLAELQKSMTRHFKIVYRLAVTSALDDNRSYVTLEDLHMAAREAAANA